MRADAGPICYTTTETLEELNSRNVQSNAIAEQLCIGGLSMLGGRYVHIICSSLCTRTSD